MTPLVSSKYTSNQLFSSPKAMLNKKRVSLQKAKISKAVIQATQKKPMNQATKYSIPVYKTTRG